MNKYHLVRVIRSLAIVSTFLFSLSTQAATVGLTAITVNGDKMVNDSVLGVTWADTTSNPVTFYSGPSNAFSVQYAGSAQEWIAGLNSNGYGGHNDWRLATSSPLNNYYTCASGNNALGCVYYGIRSPDSCMLNSSNEMECLFYKELGNSFMSPATSFNPFSTLQAYPGYWSGSEYIHGYSSWVFLSNNNGQIYNYMDRQLEYGTNFALAVRTGLTEVAPVPLPASAWLLLSGLGGLGFLSRKRKAMPC